MTLNLFQNTLDNNILNYGIILASVSILGISMYYFSNINFNSNIIKNNSTLQDADTITQSVVNNLKSHPITGQDTVIPKLTNETLDSLIKIESTVQTEPSVTTTADSAVQTDIKMLYDYLKELLYNTSTPNQSLGEISPTEFINEYRNNPEYASYFQNTAKWTESIGDPSLFRSHSSEYNFLSKLREALGVDSPVSTISNSVPQIREPIIPQTEIEGIKMAKFDEICQYLNLKYPGTTSDPFIKDWLMSLIDSYDYVQLLSITVNSEIINKVNCNIILWTCGIF